MKIPKSLSMRRKWPFVSCMLLKLRPLRYRLIDLKSSPFFAMKYGKSLMEEFTEASIDTFLPIEMWEERAMEFAHSEQGTISMRDYYFKFTKLSMYDPYVFPNIRYWVCHFVQGLEPQVINKTSITDLNSNMNLQDGGYCKEHWDLQIVERVRERKKIRNPDL